MNKKQLTGKDGNTFWIPFKDNPSGAVTKCMMGIIIATLIVFIWQFLTPLNVQEQYFYGHNILMTKPWTLITYMFMHYPPQLDLITVFGMALPLIAIVHIVGNLWYLQLFMNNLEEKVGYMILPFYLIGGIIAGIGFGLVFQNSFIVGASGAVSAVMGAYWMAFPHNKLTLAGLPQGELFRVDDVYKVMKLKDKIKYKTILCRTWLWSWFIWQLPICFLEGQGTAYLAHVIAFVFGALAVVVFRKVRLYKWLSFPDYNFSSFDTGWGR